MTRWYACNSDRDGRRYSHMIIVQRNHWPVKFEDRISNRLMMNQIRPTWNSDAIATKLVYVGRRSALANNQFWKRNERLFYDINHLQSCTKSCKCAAVWSVENVCSFALPLGVVLNYVACIQPVLLVGSRSCFFTKHTLSRDYCKEMRNRIKISLCEPGKQVVCYR